MKKVVFLLMLMFALCGCSVQTFEKVEDPNDVAVLAKPATLLLDLPEEAAAPTMQGETGTLYFCGDYDITVEIIPSGNLDKTLQTLTGFERKELDLMQTVRCGAECYEAVWSAAGEAGDHIGRVLVLDDGSYHYCVSIMAMAEDAGETGKSWNKIMESVALFEG